MLYLTARRETNCWSWLEGPTVQNFAVHCRPSVVRRYGFQSLENLRALNHLPVVGKKSSELLSLPEQHPLCSCCGAVTEPSRLCSFLPWGNKCRWLSIKWLPIGVVGDKKILWVCAVTFISRNKPCTQLQNTFEEKEVKKNVLNVGSDSYRKSLPEKYLSFPPFAVPTCTLCSVTFAVFTIFSKVLDKQKNKSSKLFLCFQSEVARRENVFQCTYTLIKSLSCRD